MRIRMLKEKITPKGKLKLGDVIDVAPWVAQNWIARGDAMEDKAYEPKESKVVSSAPDSAGALIVSQRVRGIVIPKTKGG